MSPIIFLLSFNQLLKLSAQLNQGHGYKFELPLQNSEDLPPINSSIYVKWLEEDDDEPPGWYQARVSEYLQDGFCTITYDETAKATVFETVDLRTVEWLPCSRRARRFVPLHLCLVSTKSKQKPCLKYYKSSEHSIKAYADDATLISDCLETHTKVLQQVDQI